MKASFKVATAIVVASVLFTPLALDAATQASNKATTSQAASTVDRIAAQGISLNAVKTAYKAYEWSINQSRVEDKDYLTIVDFSLPSNQKRLFVVDMNTKKVIMREYVSQGAGSGRGAMATKFSDTDGSHASVLGAMVTTDAYSGKHGTSLRLEGLESRNKNVMDRAVVIHAADYVSEQFIKEYNRAGNSWGCFAVDPKVSKKLIDTIKGGSVVFAYAPSRVSATDYA